MPLYSRFNRIRLQLLGKVKFTEDEDDENKMPISLAKYIINEAEGEVEQELSPRYAIPFQTIGGQPFSQLPLRPTIQILQTLAELKSVMRLLETDFGSGTAVSGDKYYKTQDLRFNAIVKRLLASEDDNLRDWLYPPLDGLMLAYQNAAGDDGFAGRVLRHSELDSITDYPIDRINSPGETFWNATDEEINKLV